MYRQIQLSILKGANQDEKKLLSLLLVAAMLFAMTACSSTSNSSDGSVVFKIGGTGPLTGGAAIYGHAAKNGAQIAVDEINAMGGIQFDLRYEDDVNDAEKAINAYNTLKDWGIQISLGSVTSKPCEATSAETYVDRIFALTPSASSPAVLEGKDNQYQICFADPNLGSASASIFPIKSWVPKSR